MMWRKILILDVDRRQKSTAAIATGRALADSSGAEVFIAELAAPSWGAGKVDLDVRADETRCLFTVNDRLASRILALARREGIDAIVVEHRLGVEPGNLTRRLVRDARRPVIIVPTTAKPALRMVATDGPRPVSATL
jgi:nucleotide-binding universal stress UspA family protein